MLLYQNVLIKLFEMWVKGQKLALLLGIGSEKKKEVFVKMAPRANHTFQFIACLL
jgi:hypothetical protein